MGLRNLLTRMQSRTSGAICESDQGRKDLSVISERQEETDLDPEKMRGRLFDLSGKRIASCKGFDLYVMPNDYVGGPILTSGIYEPHVEAVIRKEFGDGDVFLDIGANVGFFSMLASSLSKRGKVISFEPNNQNLQLIYCSIVHNDFLNVKVYPYAVSDNERLLRFATVGSNGFVVGDVNNLDMQYLFVQAVKLDDILRDEPRIDFVKIDVEAHEPFAIHGMSEILARHRPKIMTEFHPWLMKRNNSADPMQYLLDVIDKGYRLSVVPFQGKLIPMRNAEDVMNYYKSIDIEKIHVDLFGQPV